MRETPETLFPGQQPVKRTMKIHKRKNGWILGISEEGEAQQNSDTKYITYTFRMLWVRPECRLCGDTKETAYLIIFIEVGVPQLRGIMVSVMSCKSKDVIWS